MPVTNYHTVNGRLIGETTAGVRTDYLTDALGSITATVNESAQIINTYRYKPFGERLAKTGSGADPRFQFTGDTGSVTTSRRYAENYNRRRSLDVKDGRWGSVDPLWPRQPAYEYAGSQPTCLIDPSGYKPDCRHVFDAFLSGGIAPSSAALSKCKDRHGKPCQPKVPSACLMTCLYWKESQFGVDPTPGFVGGLNISPATIALWCKKSCISEVLGVPPNVLRPVSACVSVIRNNPYLLKRLAMAIIACDGLRGYGYGILPTPHSNWLGEQYAAMFSRCEQCVCKTMMPGYVDLVTPGFCGPLPDCENCLANLNMDQSDLNDRDRRLWSRTN